MLPRSFIMSADNTMSPCSRSLFVICEIYTFMQRGNFSSLPLISFLFDVTLACGVTLYIILTISLFWLNLPSGDSVPCLVANWLNTKMFVYY